MINGLIFSLVLFSNGQPVVGYPDLTLKQCELVQQQIKPVKSECVLVAVGV